MAEVQKTLRLVLHLANSPVLLARGESTNELLLDMGQGARAGVQGWQVTGRVRVRVRGHPLERGPEGGKLRTHERPAFGAAL